MNPDPIFEDENFVPSFLAVVEDLRVSQKDIIEKGFERSVAPNTVSQILSRKKNKGAKPSSSLAVDLIRALANIEGLDRLLQYLLSPTRKANRKAYHFIYKCVVVAYIDQMSPAGIKRKNLDPFIFEKIKPL